MKRTMEILERIAREDRAYLSRLPEARKQEPRIQAWRETIKKIEEIIGTKEVSIFN